MLKNFEKDLWNISKKIKYLIWLIFQIFIIFKIMEFLFTIESLGPSFMEICLGANGIGGIDLWVDKNFSYLGTLKSERFFFM